MTYLLDTNAVSALIRRVPSVLRRFDLYRHGPRCVISTITLGELLYGIERLPAGKKRDLLAREVADCLAEITCVSIPEPAGRHYSRLRVEAESRGMVMGENDLWIAATAIAMDVTLVAADDDFSHCVGLRLEDWTK